MGVFSRPFGTDSTSNVFPAVNCRAIVSRPYGTKPENGQTPIAATLPVHMASVAGPMVWVGLTPLRGGSLAVRTKSSMTSQSVTVNLGMHRSRFALVSAGWAPRGPSGLSGSAVSSTVVIESGGSFHRFRARADWEVVRTGFRPPCTVKSQFGKRSRGFLITGSVA
jgi:hypothetical protein